MVELKGAWYTGQVAHTCCTAVEDSRLGKTETPECRDIADPCDWYMTRIHYITFHAKADGMRQSFALSMQKTSMIILDHIHSCTGLRADVPRHQLPMQALLRCMAHNKYECTSGWSKQKRSSPRRCQGSVLAAPVSQSSSCIAFAAKATTKRPLKMFSQWTAAPFGTARVLEVPGQHCM